MALEQQWQPGRLERMEGMAGFVQKGANIVVNAYSIHEDERLLSKGQRLAVGTGRFAFAILQVEQLRINHRLVVAAEVRIDVPEDVCGALDKGLDVCKRLEGRPPAWVDRRVPRSELIELHLAASPIMDAHDGRQDRLFHCLVESRAVLRRVVESVLFLVDVVAIVVETGILSGLLTEVVHTVEDAGDHVALLDIRLGANLECTLAKAAIA